jgi:translation initiation factor IF-2
MTTTSKEKTNLVRPPIVVVMGHIDHGKSTLLDYIRKSNVVAGEAGGITQHISAYEVIHKDEHGADRKITFLDTPGHEAFSKMRERGAEVADIAILVVSAEDSVKTQTIEAWNTIKESGIPCIVAINKIDKPGANLDKTKIDLAEKEIYLEGFGGDIPYAEISAKVGTGVDTLLDVILIVADLGEFTYDPTLPASGFVIESKMDTKRGASASLVIKDGTLKKGMFVVAENALANTRIVENFLGVQIDAATCSSPIKITGWDTIPPVGAKFQSYESKKEAEAAAKENASAQKAAKQPAPKTAEGMKLIPLIIKTDVLGTMDALEKEIAKMATDKVAYKIIQKGVGAIGEGDAKQAIADKETLIAGFNVKVDNSAFEIAEKNSVQMQTFDIIYKLTDWLREMLEARRPRETVVETTGKAKILKIFNKTKERLVIGGKVIEGKLTSDATVRILRRDFEIGQGKVVELQQGKIKSREVLEEAEFGMMLETKTEIAPGDVIEAFTLVEK